MNDFEALTDWIQPRHLTPAGVDAYRADFENHPVRMLRLTDFLKEDVAAGLGQFLGREANYRSVYRLHPSSRYRLNSSAWVSEEIWRMVDEKDRFYTLQLLIGPDPHFRLSPNLWTFLNFCNLLATPAFKDFIRVITGFPIGNLDRNEVHRMRIGDVVKPHAIGPKGAAVWRSCFEGRLRRCVPHYRRR